MFFTVEQRDRARRLLLERALDDPRVVAAAVVGAEAAGRVDRWSDLDLSFGVAGDATVDEVLAGWTRAVSDELEAHYFKLLFGAAVENRRPEPISRLAETPRQRFGLCLLYLVRARFGVERGNLQQAEHYVRLAAELLDDGEPALPTPPTRAALLEAVQETLELLMRDPGEGRDLAERLKPQLHELTRPTPDAG